MPLFREDVLQEKGGVLFSLTSQKLNFYNLACEFQITVACNFQAVSFYQSFPWKRFSAFWGRQVAVMIDATVCFTTCVQMRV